MIPLYKIIVDVGLAKSNARKLISGKGVKLDDFLVQDEKFNLKLSDREVKLLVDFC